MAPHTLNRIQPRLTYSIRLSAGGRQNRVVISGGRPNGDEISWSCRQSLPRKQKSQAMA